MTRRFLSTRLYGQEERRSLLDHRYSPCLAIQAAFREQPARSRQAVPSEDDVSPSRERGLQSYSPRSWRYDTKLFSGQDSHRHVLASHGKFIFLQMIDPSETTAATACFGDVNVDGRLA